MTSHGGKRAGAGRNKGSVAATRRAAIATTVDLETARRIRVEAERRGVPMGAVIDELAGMGERLSELEKRVAALEKSPPEKKRRELMINLDVLTQGNKPESREAFEARVRRAIKEVLET
jgi:hypothetical protein